MQSGKDRGEFTQGKNDLKVHKGRVTGLGIDYLNKYLVSASTDGTIKQWDFYRAICIKSVQMSSPNHLVYNRMNDLVAVSTANLEIKVLNNNSGSTSNT
jgi:WD40 repeat protein